MRLVNTAPAKRQPATRCCARAWELTSIAARPQPADAASASCPCRRSAKAVVWVAVMLWPGQRFTNVPNKPTDWPAEAAEAGRDVAMQAAAMNPVALNRDAVSQEVIDRELEVGKELARQEGKPEEMLEKIATGRLNKFFKENTLVDQAFIKDGKMSVAKYLTSVQAGLEVVDFKRVSL